MLIPLLLVGWLMVRWSGSAQELVWATLRMVVQLLGMGYLLIILFGQDRHWITALVVLFMLVVSAAIAIRMIREDRLSAFKEALLAIGVGGGSVFVLVVFGVLEGGQGFSARFVVPLAGMIFANAMTAVTLCAERFESERAAGRGSREARNAAWQISLIPQINSFLAVGLVSLPGMMTGQIIAGASPLDAVRYQILVMAMVLGSTGISVAIFLARAARGPSEN